MPTPAVDPFGNVSTDDLLDPLWGRAVKADIDYLYANSGGAGGVMTPFTVIGTGDGFNKDFYLTLNAQYEQIFVGALPQPVTAYTRTNTLIHFATAPPNGAVVLESLSQPSLAGSDAATLNGHAAGAGSGNIPINNASGRVPDSQLLAGMTLAQVQTGTSSSNITVSDYLAF